MNFKKWEPTPGDMKVTPLSKKTIHSIAKQVRSCFNQSTPFDLEILLNKLSEEDILDYAVIPDNQMQDCHGITNGNFITFNESVINAVSDPTNPEHNMHRVTVAHEIGNAILHRNVCIEGLARRILPKRAFEMR